VYHLAAQSVYAREDFFHECLKPLTTPQTHTEHPPWITSVPAGQEQRAATLRRPTLLLLDEHRIMRQGMEELAKRTGDFEVIGDCGTGL